LRLPAITGNAMAMSKPYRLQPVLDKKRQKWRLDLPPQVSPSGKRERHLFTRHSEALGSKSNSADRSRLWSIGKSAYTGQTGPDG
jgi:hypothetical protein